MGEQGVRTGGGGMDKVGSNDGFRCLETAVLQTKTAGSGRTEGRKKGRLKDEGARIAA